MEEETTDETRGHLEVGLHDYTKHNEIRMPDLRHETSWFQTAVFYEVYVRAFCDENGDGHGDLAGLTNRLDYLQNLGVDCLWLLPICPSPLKDDGYDVSDYRGIHEQYGNLEAFKELINSVHDRNMRIIMDLVPNHTSDQHWWFKEARKNKNSPYRDYYVWSDDPLKYSSARIIFVDSENSNWTWDEVAGQWYWHRFFSSQPDLNFENPKVQQEMLDIVSHWLEMGVDGFRVDAVPYLFEEENTSCENLPKTHEFLKKLRKHVKENYPGSILLSEACQLPKDVIEYFGQGDEFHMAFHFPVMPRIFMCLQSGESNKLREIMEDTPPIPEGCQWAIFLRNHDELTLEMVTPEERKWMWEKFAPEPRMKINVGIRRRLSPLLNNDRRKIELAYSLLLTLPGSPILYYGDEIGMGDNIYLPDRNGVRTPMQWDDEEPSGGFSERGPADFYAPMISTPPYDKAMVNVRNQLRNQESLFHAVKHMIAKRKKHSVFGKGQFLWAENNSQHVASYFRIGTCEEVLVISNLSEKEVQVEISLPWLAVPTTTTPTHPPITQKGSDFLLLEAETIIDLLTEQIIPLEKGKPLSLLLSPFQFLWLLFLPYRY